MPPLIQMSTLSLRLRAAMVTAISLVAGRPDTPRAGRRGRPNRPGQAATAPRYAAHANRSHMVTARTLAAIAPMRKAIALVVVGYLAFAAGCASMFLGVALGVFAMHGDARGVLPVIVGTVAMLALCLASVISATATPQPSSTWGRLGRYCLVTFAAVGALAAAILIMWTMPVTLLALGEVFGPSEY
jgi:hypothetical protein